MNGRKIVACAALASVLAWFLGASAGQVASRPATATAAGKLITVDRAKRQVVIEATVAVQAGLLEFVLCRKGTKDHESLAVTEALPSSLHAALLSLGLTPGKPAQWVSPPGKEPVFVPPSGPMLDIRMRWTDAKGNAREVPASEWLLTAGTKKPVPQTHWVFVGSDILEDGQYWADVEGQVISVANFAASVVDVPFRSTDRDALLEFAGNGDLVPPKGTAIQVVIVPVKGAETAPAARVSFAIDSLGRLELDGQNIAVENVAEAVRKFMSRHAQGAADVRVDPRAMVFDQERLRDVLREAGLTDVTFRRMGMSEELLPRTAAEAARAIEWWKGRFAQAQDLIRDPGEDADAALNLIQRRRKDLELTSALWDDYARQLRLLLEEHRRKHPASAPDSQPRN